jgi:hypothetical protein
MVIIDPRIEMARCYHKVFKVWPNFKEPKSLIEKVYWLQLETDTSLWSLCTDKYRVRNYVIEKGLGDYLNELYGVWENVDEIDFNSLPPKCVLKTNNGCGQTIFYDKGIPNCNDLARKLLEKWKRHPFGVSGGELHYLNIKPLIIAEKPIPIPESKVSLTDYKIWCFAGKPFCILVVYGRENGMVNLALFDLDWNILPHYLKSTKHAICDPNASIPKPDSLDEMIRIAGILSKGFPEVRVDLYEVDKKPLFGEMTFSTGFGYFTDEFYRILGDKVVLPRKGE